MMVSFDKAFKPTIRDKIRSYEKLLELHKEQIGQCSTCKYFIGPSTNPFVIDYGLCLEKDPTFYDKIRYPSTKCVHYKENTTQATIWENALKSLRDRYLKGENDD